ncbi:MAG: glycosyltransferase family 39 protein [Phycisphaerae bacterium]|nr:glycosyltransferase family 39 protein [Phycisphaerae bacterium]
MNRSLMNPQSEPFVATSPSRGGWRPQLCLVLILLSAAGLRLWNLADHGFGNIYYAAAVRSMAGSWHNFLYASFDPSGFLMLDKPPVAFWLQVLSVKLLGFDGLSLHLPQVIEGVLAVFLVYVLTRRVAGECRRRSQQPAG